MTEKNFSANFQMYNMDGLRLQFTVRSDDAQEHMQLLQQQLDWLTREGYSVHEPDANAKPKTVPIVAFVRGTAQDGKTASFMPCVHLYSPWGNFKATTVYHERLDDLPFDWQDAPLYDGAAPDRDTAQKRRVLTSCDEFKVVLAPRTDYEGNVKRSDSGNIMYAYDRVLTDTAAPQRTETTQPSNRTTTHRNGAHSPSVSVEDEVSFYPDEEPIPFGFEDNPFDGPSQDSVMHALGTALYAKEWNTKRKDFVKRFGKESSKDLDGKQMTQLIGMLCEVARSAIEKNFAAFAPGELDHLLAEGNGGNRITLPDASAMTLTHVVKVLQKKRQPA